MSSVAMEHVVSFNTCAASESTPVFVVQVLFLKQRRVAWRDSGK